MPTPPSQQDNDREAAGDRLRALFGPASGIVDPHVHLWSPEEHGWLTDVPDPEHPYHRFAPIAKKDYGVNAYLKDSIGSGGVSVRGAVTIQANGHVRPGMTDVEGALAEVAFWDNMATSLPAPSSKKKGPALGALGAIGYAPLHRPAEVEALLRGFWETSRQSFRGVRFMLDWSDERPEMRQTDRPDYMTDPEFRTFHCCLLCVSLSVTSECDL